MTICTRCKLPIECKKLFPCFSFFFFFFSFRGGYDRRVSSLEQLNGKVIGLMVRMSEAGRRLRKAETKEGWREMSISIWNNGMSLYQLRVYYLSCKFMLLASSLRRDLSPLNIFSLPTGIILNVSAGSYGGIAGKKEFASWSQWAQLAGSWGLQVGSPVPRFGSAGRFSSAKLLPGTLARSSPAVSLGRFSGAMPLRHLPVSSFPWRPLSSKFHQKWHPSNFGALSEKL